MPYRIEIGLKRGAHDARGHGVKAKARQILNLPIRSVQTRTVYKVDAPMARSELKAVRQAFTDPVIETSAAGRLRPPRFDWLIEVGFKPGVTDNVGRTARVALSDVLDRALDPGEDVYTSLQYFIRAPEMSREQARQLGTDLLANPLIHSLQVFSADEWRTHPADDSVPAIHDKPEPEAQPFDLQGTDADLVRISREHILSLNIEEMRTIRDYFNSPDVRAARQALHLPEQPTDVEVECVAQSWSEHCCHKIFAARIRYVDEQGREQIINSLFDTFVKGATRKIAESVPWLVSVFTDNAGIIRFNERLNLVYKVETHNSPSALDPYGGAMTGIVGVNRDPMGTGMGAALLCNVWGYCLGSPFYKGHLPEGLMHPRRIRDGVHLGVIEGGNQSGIPWARGWEVFADRFIGKPLVFCGTVGTLPVKVNGRPSEEKVVLPGDAMVMVGGRIGKDGIHGATFSSEELRTESPVQAVQIGDPITQRKMYEFLLEARDLGLYRCITDNGAGGLSCSIGEMGRMSGGADLDLARAPLKYQGLKPWEILLSEAQERMTLAVAPDNVKDFLTLAQRRDVDANVLGTFTDSGVFLIRYGERVVGRLDMNFLYKGCPVMDLEARWTPPDIPGPAPMRGGNRTRALRNLLGSLNVCSKEFKSRQYDGEVKGLSVVKPYGGVFSDMPSDATILRIDYAGQEGILLAEGINPFYSDIDTYWMMASVIDEAVRRIISAGGTLGLIAGLDNFCWPDPVESEKTPDGQYKLAQLVRANQALYDITTAYRVPCISGKDSCKNDSTRGGRKISIPPTVLFSTIAPMGDIRQAVTMDMKRAGDLIYVIGLTRNELGASAFHRMAAEQQGTPERYGGIVPHLDAPGALALYTAMNLAIARGLLRSSHTPTRGGLAVAITLSALGGNLGAHIDLTLVPAAGALTDDALLFSESNSRFVVTVAPENAGDFETLFANLPCARVGETTPDAQLIITGQKGHTLIQSELNSLRKVFKGTLHGI
ncbi:MAG: phosphoribosylformylglycinamidine synthase [Verrucomicrobia bacterium]|nr:phosphoribosylformylglycinamidine synthase [Verrucomicrobiota bacterium]MCG2681895.1 AIR synthase-related protein [Kiritimatiellia bacterium]MBU4246735.1 phosphoribosylformylglycinamidine synthase [Verrucomicrobiota bacterium]MBU4291156.1 phosphoribosylformylglycinamidine synthase [Verrucomicrobiota bacterium]MBU4429260.1 phosphoribosylformylglycinamidine synthase [Verrucomicrobiota bacterium]